MLRTSIKAARAVATTSARRLTRRAPLVEGWRLRDELLIGFLQVVFARRQPVEASRRQLDRFTAREAGLAAWETLEVAGMKAAWARPKPGVPRSGVTVLYLHGGAYAVGSIRSHRTIIERFVPTSGADFLVVEYRLAPEHPCPAAIDDVLAAWRWLLDTGVDPSTVVFAGDSAGGGLVLTSLMALRDAGAPMPAMGVCISPWTDLTLSGASYTDNAPYDYLGFADIDGFAGHYAGRLPRTDPRVSPAFGDFAGLPPLFIQVGGVEVLLDDARTVAEKARAAGVDVTLEVWPGQVHVWHGFAEILPAGREASERVGAVIGARSAR